MLWVSRLLPAHLLASLGEVQALTALMLQDCGIQHLPPSLSRCTPLRGLNLLSCPRLCSSAEGAASLDAVLQQLPRLEHLRLRGCGLTSLPALTGGLALPPLRQLHISGNPCVLPGASWLASLEVLLCDWGQVLTGLLLWCCALGCTS